MHTYAESTRAALAYLKIHYASLAADHADLVQDAWVALLAEGMTPGDVGPNLLIQHTKNLARNAVRVREHHGEHVSFDAVFGERDED